MLDFNQHTSLRRALPIHFLFFLYFQIFSRALSQPPCFSLLFSLFCFQLWTAPSFLAWENNVDWHYTQKWTVFSLYVYGLICVKWVCFRREHITHTHNLLRICVFGPGTSCLGGSVNSLKIIKYNSIPPPQGMQKGPSASYKAYN